MNKLNLDAPNLPPTVIPTIDEQEQEIRVLIPVGFGLFVSVYNKYEWAVAPLNQAKEKTGEVAGVSKGLFTLKGYSTIINGVSQQNVFICKKKIPYPKVTIPK